MLKVWAARWLNGWQQLLRRSRPIPDALWQKTLANYPFLTRQSDADTFKLRTLAGQFLADKQFSGAHGLVVTDEMAIAIAAQACLPVLHLGLKLYNDFKGIVVHPGAMLARREVQDAAGVVHRYNEVLAGEAMARGPITLSWQDIGGGAAAASERAARGYNVVIHEFVHKIDMRGSPGGQANGCPPLPSRAAKAAWLAVMTAAYDDFKHRVVMADRFGGDAPWLDAYGATSPAEFYAVASEAYFVSRARFAQDFAALTTLFDQFYLPNSAMAK